MSSFRWLENITEKEAQCADHCLSCVFSSPIPIASGQSQVIHLFRVICDLLHPDAPRELGGTSQSWSDQFAVQFADPISSGLLYLRMWTGLLAVSIPHAL